MDTNDKAPEFSLPDENGKNVALKDFRGKTDDHGKELSATVLAVADEIAAASGLLMRKTARIPVVVMRGYYFDHGEGNAMELVRPRERDLFR